MCVARRKGTKMALILSFTSTWSWHWLDPNILPKGFLLLWLLAQNQQLTEMLWPTASFFADKPFVWEDTCKKLPCSTLVSPLTKKIIHCLIMTELLWFCNPEKLWTQIWRCRHYLPLFYNSYSYSYGYVSRCKNISKTQYLSTSVHSSSPWT